MKRIRNGKLSWLKVLSELKMRGSGGSGGEAEEEAQLSWQRLTAPVPLPHCITLHQQVKSLGSGKWFQDTSCYLSLKARIFHSI